MDSPQMLSLTVDGQAVEVPAGSTLLDAIRSAGQDVPVLCHSDRMDAAGVCRLCVVDVGERTLAAACHRPCQSGQQVVTDSDSIRQHRKQLVQLLLAEHPVPCVRQQTTRDCELERLAGELGLMEQDTPELIWQQLPHPPRLKDASSAVIDVDHSACILCDRCIRACDDVQNNHIIGRTGKGHTAAIAFDLDEPMGRSQCVSCGECVSECPTGALTNRSITLPIVDRDQMTATDTVCPYCGVGCATRVYTQNEKIVLTEGRDSPVNEGRLCVKGRYGWDYAFHPHRLTKPLIRRESHYPKQPLSAAVQSSTPGRRQRPGGLADLDEVLPAFREASWDEALDLVANRLQQTRNEFGPDAIAGFGSAKCSNEEAYLFQKLIRAGLGTNNVDHCTRLCHASSVAALMETIGSGAVTNVFGDVVNSDVVLITGSNAPANHPVAATFMKQAARNGTRVILVDVRRNEIADFADEFASIRPGTDVAFYNGLMHVLIRDRQYDEEFVNSRTSGFDQLQELVLADYSPTQAAAICGVKPEQIERIARIIGDASSMLVFWGMGISQHTTGTDNARCLISLCLLTGNVGRAGTGLHPLRGQNNVQGASDAGLIPMVYPGYQSVASDEIQQKFSQAWDRPLSREPGLTVVEIVAGALTKSIRSMYIMGENPFLSDPNTNKVRQALAELDFLAVQDIFLTETAEFADVILPASSYFEKLGTYTNTDRRVQVGRPVVAPPGEARPDWQILCELGSRIGLPMNYDSPESVFEEFVSLTPSYESLDYDTLGTTGQLWPYDAKQGAGQQLLFGDSFPTEDGRGRLVPCPYQPPDEVPDREYPYVLNTGRVLEHWHTGSMTRRSTALDAIQPDAFAALHPIEFTTLGIQPGERIAVSSRRGRIELQARSDRSVEPGSVFIPFHFREAAANTLTNDALDPFGKIPEFKYCAVKIERLESVKTG